MPPTDKYWRRILVIGFAVLLIGGGIVSMLLPQKGFSESENRYLQKRPRFTWNSFLDGSFATRYEAYLSDQFPGRDNWVGIKTMTERILGKTDANGVYFGNGGYLIEKFEAEDIETELLHRNLKSISEALHRMEAEYGTDHVRVMLVPGASQILTGKLPPFAAPYNQTKVTDELKKQWNAAAFVVPVEETLREHQDDPLYYRTDHHWTTLGAYYGYTAWMQSLGKIPEPLDRFTKTIVSQDFYGTLYSKVQGTWSPDEITLYDPTLPVQYEVEYDNSGTVTDTLYSLESLTTRDQYSVFLDGNHGLTRITNKSAYRLPEAAGKKLLIIKDSYAHSFAPFAAPHFEETLMLDLRYFNANPEVFAKSENITDVLFLYRIPGLSNDVTLSKLRSPGE